MGMSEKKQWQKHVWIEVQDNSWEKVRKMECNAMMEIDIYMNDRLMYGCMFNGVALGTSKWYTIWFRHELQWVQIVILCIVLY